MDTLLFEFDNTLTLAHTLTILGSAIGISLLIALAYRFAKRKTGFSAGLMFSLIMLGPISSIVILIVGNSVARALSVGGGIALIRYRNTLSDPWDLAFIFMSLSLGMACGLGFIGFAVLAAILMVILVFILCLLNSRQSARKNTPMRLKILVPEDMNYYGAFDDIMSKYAISPYLEKVRTTDYGTLFELNYRLRLRSPENQKQFIDEIRTRNGNMTVTLTRYADEIVSK